MLITTEEIFEEFEDLDPRDQSQYLLELGYDLPRFSADQQKAEDLVQGCQSQVWLTAVASDDSTDPVISIKADSDAEIVRGLITILLASYDGMKASEILQLSIVDVFNRLKLKQYISPQRHNGLQGMVDRIREISAMYCNAQTSPVAPASNCNIAVKAKRPPVLQQSFDVQKIRSQFPVLNQILEDGQTPVYLDSGASAQKPQLVIDKEREVEEQYFANAYRGKYSFGARIDEELEASRKKIAEFIGSATSEQICFTGGTTMTLNMVAFGWGRRHLKPGDEILITEMEHHANFVPWQQLASQTGATLRFMPLTPDGRIDLEQLETVLSNKTKNRCRDRHVKRAGHDDANCRTLKTSP